MRPLPLLAALMSAAPLAAQQDEALIRAARAASNAAIALHDAAGVAASWMEDYHIVTSTGAQRAGRAANLDDLAAAFRARPDVVYVRTPETVEVFGAWEVASERGRWTGEWTQADGTTRIGGTYLAQWRKVGGRWLLQAELFVPTFCRGSSYCERHP